MSRRGGHLKACPRGLEGIIDACPGGGGGGGGEWNKIEACPGGRNKIEASPGGIYKSVPGI